MENVEKIMTQINICPKDLLEKCQLNSGEPNSNILIANRQPSRKWSTPPPADSPHRKRLPMFASFPQTLTKPLTWNSSFGQYLCSSSHWNSPSRASMCCAGFLVAIPHCVIIRFCTSANTAVCSCNLRALCVVCWSAALLPLWTMLFVRIFQSSIFYYFCKFFRVGPTRTETSARILASQLVNFASP